MSRDLAVSRAPLRRVGRRPARRAGRAALRRDRRGGASGLPRDEPAQHRPPDAARLRGGRRGDARRLARARRDAARGARAVVDRAALHRPGRRRAHARGARGGDRGDAVLRAQGAAARAHARRPEGGPAAAAARDAHPARADLPALRRRPGGRAARPRAGHGRRPGRRAHAGLAPAGRGAGGRRAAADRRRPSPLRDGRRVPRGGPVGDAHVRRARLDALAGRRDLPDAPRRARRSTPSPRASRRRAGTSRRSRSTAAASSSASTRTTTRSTCRRSSASSRRASTYTPYAEEAIAAVDEGEADSAFLVRAPTIAQVAEFAERGETMPQKSTYFFPKLTSGLLLFPL